MQGLKIQMVHHGCGVPGSVEQKRSGGRVRTSHDVVHLEGITRHVKIVPRRSLIPGEDHLLRSLHIVRHHQQSSMVTDLVDESSLVSFKPRQPAVSGDVRVDLVLLKAQGLADVPRSHDDPDGCLCGVERGVVAEVGHAVEVEPALVLRAVDRVPDAVHLRSLEVRPDAALVKGDHSLDGVLIFSFALHPVLLVHAGLGEPLILDGLGLCRVLGSFRILGRHLFEIRDVNPLQIQHLVEFAVPRGTPDIVGQGQGVPGARLIGDVHAADVVPSFSLPVVHVEDHGTLGSVENVVGLLIQIHVQLGPSEGLGPIR
mmetsp:Transcript_4511/g.10922  ORF Transcript_4511/g.10922 Transcript_4511/m.10922 type:complete len:314 (-) Transcript_4511:827-1768(-)